MSNDVTTPADDAPGGTPTKGRRKLWVAAGVAGLTGIVGLAAMGGLAARDDKPDADRLSDARSSTPRQNVSDAGKVDDVTLRHKVVGNRAIGPFGRSGGIHNTDGGTVTLDDTRVTHNFATRPPGGIFNAPGSTATLDESAVAGDRPTNCVNVPGCFA